MAKSRARRAARHPVPGWRQRLAAALTVLAILAVIASGFTWALWIHVWRPAYIARDTEGTPIQEGTAIVTASTYLRTTRANPVPRTLLRLRLNDQEVDAESHSRFRVGDPVRLRYQVGKSGVVYVEDVWRLR